MTNRKNDIIQEAIKKAKKESVMGKLGDSPYEDPMEPWSGKYQSPVKEELIVEVNTMLLFRYIKAQGYNPEFMTFAQRSSYARSNAFKRWKEEHKADQLTTTKEEVENLDEAEVDEMAGANMDTRAVHQHLKKVGWKLTRSSGGHDVFTHPESDKSIPVPRHKQLKAPLVLSIMKSSKIEAKKLDEAGTGLLMSYIKAKGLNPLSMDGNQKSAYSRSSEFQQYKSKRASESLGELKELYGMKGLSDLIINQQEISEISGMGERGDDWNESAGAKLSMPLKGHPYHKKSDAELRYIQKDAAEAAKAMKGHAPNSEAKYLDQVNDASTVLYYRGKGGKQLAKEEVEIDEAAKWRQGYSASGHPPGYKHKSGEIGPLGGTYTNEPSGYDGDTSKSPVNKYRDAADPLASRDKTKLSTTGKKLLARNAMSNLKAAITRSKGTHGPVGKLPEENEIDEADNLTMRGMFTANPGSIPSYMRSTEKGKKSLADKNKPVLKDLIKRQLGKHPKPNLPEEVDLEEETDKKDTVTLDIPLMIRVLEYAREDAKTDMDSHKVVENLINLRGEGPLSMEHYDAIVNIKGTVKESSELDEASYGIGGYTRGFDRSKQRFKSNELSKELGHEVGGRSPMNPVEEPHAVHINGKKWKTFGSKSHATNVAKSLTNKVSGVTVVKEENLTEFKKQPDNMDADDHITREEKVMSKKDDPCWKGYRMYGKKNKGGKQVPNCVPEETKVSEGIYGIEDSPMSATNSVKAMENSGCKKKMSSAAKMIKSIYKEKGVSESTYDWEKENKGTKGKEVTAKITLTGGKTMTGKDRDTVEIEPVLKTKTKNTAGMKTSD